jgi:hypothetical protein
LLLSLSGVSAPTSLEYYGIVSRRGLSALPLSETDIAKAIAAATGSAKVGASRAGFAPDSAGVGH